MTFPELLENDPLEDVAFGERPLQSDHVGVVEVLLEVVLQRHHVEVLQAVLLGPERRGVRRVHVDTHLAWVTENNIM